MKLKKYFGIGLEVLLAITILAFEMVESLNFFLFVFPKEQWYLAYLGFGLTSIAMLIYFYLFLFLADSTLKKFVSLSMVAVCLIGALATAGFGMQFEANSKIGVTFTESEISFMVLAVRLLLLVHAVAMILYVGGDAVVKAFKDDDGDGIPNAFDRVDNRYIPANSPAPFPVPVTVKNVTVDSVSLETANKNPTTANTPQ